MPLLRVQFPGGREEEFDVTDIEFSQVREVTPVRSMDGPNVIELIPGDTTHTFEITMTATVQDPEPSPSRYDLLKAATK